MEKPSDLFGQPNRRQRRLESRWAVCHLWPRRPAARRRLTPLCASSPEATTRHTSITWLWTPCPALSTCPTPTAGESTASSLWVEPKTWLGTRKSWRGPASSACPLTKPAAGTEARLWTPPWWALEVKAAQQQSPTPERAHRTPECWKWTQPGQSQTQLVLEYNLILIDGFGGWVSVV